MSLKNQIAHFRKFGFASQLQPLRIWNSEKSNYHIEAYRCEQSKHNNRNMIDCLAEQIGVLTKKPTEPNNIQRFDEFLPVATKQFHDMIRWIPMRSYIDYLTWHGGETQKDPSSWYRCMIRTVSTRLYFVFET